MKRRPSKTVGDRWIEYLDDSWAVFEVVKIEDGDFDFAHLTCLALWYEDSVGPSQYKDLPVFGVEMKRLTPIFAT